MFGFGLPTSYFSLGNYDMTNGSAWGSMNLHANQNWADLLARQSLYQVPMYNLGGFSQYPTMFGNNSYLCDPMWTVGQMASTGFFGNSGFNMQFPWMQGTGNSSTPKSEEEAKMQEEYTALKELLNGYLSLNKNISTSTKTKIQTALKKSGKIEEKLAALKEVYQSIDEKKLRKTIALLGTKNTGYSQALEEAGYRFGMQDYSFNSGKESDISSTISDLKSAVDGMAGAPDNPAFATVIENNQILRIVSYWNDGHEGNKNDTMIETIISKLPSDETKKKQAFNSYVQPVVEALLAKANDVKGSDCFDDATMDKLSDMVDNLENSKKKGIKDLSNLKTHFNNLYVMLRQMEALRINSEIQNRYSFLNDIDSDDTNFINDEIIVKDTIEDLKKEGLDSLSRTIANDITVVDVEESDDSDDDAGSSRVENVEEKVEDLVDDGVLTKISKTYKGMQVYAEVEKTGGRDYIRAFILEDGELKEIGNAKVSGNDLYAIDSSKPQSLKVVDPKDIEDDYEDAVDTRENIALEQKEFDNAKSSGSRLWKLIDGNTAFGENDEVDVILNGLNSDNILGFIIGATDACDDSERLIEKLVDGSDASDAQIKNVLSLTLDKADELGLSDCSEYTELKDLYEAVANRGKGWNDTHHWDDNWLGHLLVPWNKRAKVYHNYSEVIDDALIKLCKKMKAKVKEQGLNL